MTVTEVREALDHCESFLDSANARGTEIESFLTQYLLVAAYSTFESEVEAIAIDRAAKLSDAEAAHYVRSTHDNVVRGLRLTELSGFAGRFGESNKESFSAVITNTAAHAAWDSLLNDRHASAHGEGAKMTMREFGDAFERALVVLEALSVAIGAPRSYPAGGNT